jgi:signal transduction histidine kinase
MNEFPLNMPAKGELVMDNLAFLRYGADFWLYVTLLFWFLSLYFSLEGKHLAYRRSLNQRVWLGASLICVLKTGKHLLELCLFYFDFLNIPSVTWTLHLGAVVTAVSVFFLTFPKVETAPKARRKLISGCLLVLAADFVFTVMATNFWSRDALAEAPFPELQAVVGIGGQVLISLGVLIFIAIQTERLRIDQRASRLYLDGIVIVIFLSLTYFTCGQVYDQTLKEKTAHALELVQNAVVATPDPEILLLRGVPEDLENVAFQKVYTTLARFRDINPAVEKIYLWTIRGDDFVVLADSSRREVQLPGVTPEKATERDLRIFNGSQAQIFGPFRADWGSYVCVNERIFIHGTQDVFCWMRLDLTTKDWMSTFASRRLLIMSAATLLCILGLLSNHYRLRTQDAIMLERGKQQAAEEERLRVGRDLHDDLGQLLSAINIQSTILASEIDPEAKAARRSRELCVLTQKAVVTTQEMARGLVPEDGDFAVTFRKYCQGIANGLSITCNAHDHIEDIMLPREVRVALMRVTQESMNNAVKHGKATIIDITLTIVGGSLRMELEDNGGGFQRWERQSGLGTSVMRARVEELGGTFSLGSTPGSGVVVCCTFPERWIEEGTKTRRGLRPQRGGYEPRVRASR